MRKYTLVCSRTKFERVPTAGHHAWNMKLKTRVWHVEVEAENEVEAMDKCFLSYPPKSKRMIRVEYILAERFPVDGPYESILPNFPYKFKDVQELLKKGIPLLMSVKEIEDKMTDELT